jgi:hypothetical protein
MPSDYAHDLKWIQEVGAVELIIDLDVCFTVGGLGSILDGR